MHARSQSCPPARMHARTHTYTYTYTIIVNQMVKPSCQARRQTLRLAGGETHNRLRQSTRSSSMCIIILRDIPPYLLLIPRRRKTACFETVSLAVLWRSCTHRPSPSLQTVHYRPRAVTPGPSTEVLSTCSPSLLHRCLQWPRQ